MRDVQLLECTLRDGSYAIDYQFTAKDTAIIASALQNLGFRFIEIGHGIGLNASSYKGKAAETDEVYLRTAQEVLTGSRYGMFFIPGIGRKEDLDLAAKYDMDFVRIGTDVTQADEAEEYIKYAKDLGMMVSSNLMKSYILPPREFAKKAKLVEDFGADIIVLVDSAGGMLPHDIKEYINAMKSAGVESRIGFHGHNNFSMAIANTLEAIENGATFVDSTLKGIGRSAGNAPTEILIATLDKMGYDMGIDLFRTMDVAEELIEPLIKHHGGTDSIAITSGYAQFHSSFLDRIYKAASKHSVDPRRLIISVTEKTKVDLPEKLADTLAEELHKERAALSEVSKIHIPTELEISRERWNSKLSVQEKAGILSNHLNNLSHKRGKQTIFTINISAIYDDINLVFPDIYESSSYFMAYCEMTDKDEIVNVAKNADGIVDFIVLDDEKKKEDLFDILEIIKESTNETTVLTYKGNNTWIQAIDNFISTLKGSLLGTKVGIVGSYNAALKLALYLAERGARVSLFDKRVSSEEVDALNRIKIPDSPFRIERAEKLDEFSKNADVLVGFDIEQKVDTQMVRNMDKRGIIIDAFLGSVELEALNLSREIGIETYRIDLRAAMAGELTTVLRTFAASKKIGKSYIEGIPVISPSYIGEIGDIVVDSIEDPAEIIGVADGKGNIIYDIEDEYSHRVREVELEMTKRKILGEKERQHGKSYSNPS
jgi:4-hydroxy-2-oxovalerate aldolase